MRRLLTALLLACLCLPCLGGMQVKRGTGIVAVAGAYDDILFWLNFESNASGPPDITGDYDMVQTGATQEYSAADSTGTYRNIVNCAGVGTCVQSTVAQVSTYALRGEPTDVSNWHYMEFASSGIVNLSEGSVGTWYRTNSVTSVNPWVFRVDGGSGHIGVQHNSGSVWFYYVDAAVAACAVNSSLALSADTWYYIEGKWDSAADTYQIKVTPSGGATTTDTNAVSTCGAPGTHTTLYVGNYGSTTDVFVHYHDNFAISNDYGRDLTALASEVASPR